MSKANDLSAFVIPPSKPTVDSVLQRRLTTSKGTLLPPLQAEPLRRQEMGTFMTTFRDTPNTIDHMASYKEASPSSIPPRSLEEVWLKGMYSKPAEMGTLDPHIVHKINPETGLMLVPQYTPERFERGRVQQPHVKLISVDPSILDVEGGNDGLLSPSERRERHDTAVNCRRGEEALREAYRARAKLARTCQKGYPHGALNISESPFTAEGEMAEIYEGNRQALTKEQQKANRIGKGHGAQRPSSMASVLAHNDNITLDRSNGGSNHLESPRRRALAPPSRNPIV